MSFLRLLYDESDTEQMDIDQELLWTDSPTDLDCVQVLDDVENNLEEIRYAKQVEVETHFDDVSDSELLHNVEIIESSLNHLLDLSAPKQHQQNLSRYQLPSKPMPTMNHDVVFLPAAMDCPAPEEDVSNFDLGYKLSDDEEFPMDYSVKTNKSGEEFAVPKKPP